MKKLLAGFVALPFLATVAMAGQPMTLTSAQMDQVTAGASEAGSTIQLLGNHIDIGRLISRVQVDTTSASALARVVNTTVNGNGSSVYVQTYASVD